jgi:hypothetical protein
MQNHDTSINHASLLEILRNNLKEMNSNLPESTISKSLIGNELSLDRD